MSHPPSSSQAVEITYVTGIAPFTQGDTPDSDIAAKQTRTEAELFDTNLKSYTILDAAEIMNLPEQLETSGLTYVSLFQGTAQEELESVAPYLVELKSDNRLARGLFTRSDAPWHLWDNDVVVVFQSDKTLEEMRAHFRRMTKLQTEDGAWLYFRFWSPQTLQGLGRALRASPDRVRALFSDVVQRVLFKVPGRDQIMTIVPLIREHGSVKHLSPNAEMRAALAHNVRPAQAMKLQRSTEDRLRLHDPKSYAWLHSSGRARRFGYAKHLYRMGLRDPHVCAMLVSIIAGTGLDILREPAFHYATRNPFLSPTAKARQLITSFRMIEKLKDKE